MEPYYGKIIPFSQKLIGQGHFETDRVAGLRHRGFFACAFFINRNIGNHGHLGGCHPGKKPGYFFLFFLGQSALLNVKQHLGTLVDFLCA